MSYMSVPTDDAARLAALRELGVLDTPPDAAFDGLVKAASLMCETPIALVSLFDEDRHWFKAKIGLPGVQQIPREHAICRHMVALEPVLEIEDVAADPRFADDPLVRAERPVRFYAGTPLVLRSGHQVGSLCVIDWRPRCLTPQQRDMLCALGQTAAAMLEDFQAGQRLRATAAALKKSEEFLIHSGQVAGVGGWSLDLASNQLTWSAQTCRLHGVAPDFQPDIASALQFYEPEARPRLRAAMVTCLANGGPWDLELPLMRADGVRRWVRAMGDVVVENGVQLRLSGAFQDVTDRVNERMALAVVRERMALATESGGIGIWDLDIESGAMLWNDRMFELYGLPAAQLPVPFEDWKAQLHPEDAEPTLAKLCEARAAARPFDVEHRIILADSGVRYLRSAGSFICDGDGKPSRCIGVDWDVSEARQMALQLASQHEMLRTTLQSIGDGVITADAKGLTMWLNPVAERLTGWTTAEAAGRKVSEIYAVIDEQTGVRICCPVELCLAGGAARGSLAGGSLAGGGLAGGGLAGCGLAGGGEPAQRRQRVLRGRDSQHYGVEDLASPIRDDGGDIQGAVLVFHDVTEQRRVSSEMSYRATHDALTGLLNRGEFEARLRFVLDKAHAEQTRSTILFVDLDQFKLVNDACGHSAGDRLLVALATLMSDAVRGSDTVARLGGDEFAIILNGCQPERAQSVAQGICDLIDNYRFEHDGQRFRVGASIGLVPVDVRWPAIAGIMQAADDSCYAAKEAGRNRVHVWSETDREMRDRHSEIQWAARLTRALDENHFELFAQRLQPLQTTGDGIHAEVLLRLREADGSISAPGIFIPAAERFHLASRIDRWVLRRAIDWMNNAKTAAIDMICVNLSGQSVGDRAFHRWAIGVLAVAGPDICRLLCLEITETAAITNLQDASMFIHEVRKLGVRVALDDFGAGASSFSYLKKLPVDFLKIDGQFIRNLVSDLLDQAAVRCFVDVASQLGIKTVAEYVDNPDVLRTLRVMNVDMAQGFLIHKPAPIAELLE